MWLKFCVRKMAYTDGSVAVLAECLPSVPETLGFILESHKPGMVCMPIVSVLRR